MMEVPTLKQPQRGNQWARMQEERGRTQRCFKGPRDTPKDMSSCQLPIPEAQQPEAGHSRGGWTLGHRMHMLLREAR